MCPLDAKVSVWWEHLDYGIKSDTDKALRTCTAEGVLIVQAEVDKQWD